MQSCPCRNHPGYSAYPKDEVPIVLFRKIKEDSDSTLYKYCSDCREQSRVQNKKSQSTKRAELKKIKQTERKDGDYLFCPCLGHTSYSEYPRDAVPTHMFRQHPDNKRSILFEHCSDCRDFSKKCKTKLRSKRKDVVGRDEFFCTVCLATKNVSFAAIKIDGTKGKQCSECYNKGLSRRKTIKQLRKDHLINRIIKNEKSCEKCGKIYLNPINGTDYAVEIETYDLEGIRMVDFEGQSISASDFIRDNIDILALSILDQDHLTEEEQRERGLISCEDPFVKKRQNVSQLVSKNAIELESIKTQLLCCRCHVEETMRRNTCKRKPSEKRAYVEGIKKRGCSVCSYRNTQLLPFFEFDHRLKYDKTEDVCDMVTKKEYTLEDVIAEIEKCRVVCRHCHRMHTQRQHNAGEISKKKYSPYH